jgi:6-phospho-beta-glucosidase
VRLTVLGGSTPFTVPLVEELANRVPAPGLLRLHGRDQSALEAVAGFARHRLGPGWDVETRTDVAAALSGAEVVVHQVRYGALSGRHDDEQLAQVLGVPSDETWVRPH